LNWDAVGALGEVLGSVLVMISLIYLAVQVRQSNRDAEASAEVSWMDGWNRALEGWVGDDRTIDVIRSGFRDFDGLDKRQQAIFHMRIGVLVNHWVLARKLRDKNLIPDSLYSDATDFLVSVLSTPGGLQYWRRDAEATPHGKDLLDLAQRGQGRLPPITELLPWWGDDA
jgi:hypothetical protein